MSNYQFVEKKQEGEQTIVTLKISKEIFVNRKEKVFNRLAKNIEITGFRKGKAPRAMLEARMGANLYESTLNELLPEITYEYLTEEKLDFLGRLNYKVIKVSDEEGVEFEISFINYPEVKLPDFKKIKVKEEVVEISDKEVEEEMDKVLKYQSTDKDGKDSEKKIKLDDKTVEGLGLGLKTVDELKDLVKKQMESQRQGNAVNKRLQEAIDKAIEQSKIKAPEALVEEETHKREHDYEHRIQDIGLKMEDFLKSQKTTLEDLRKDWRSQAEKQIKTDLLLFEIAKKNNLKVTNEEIQAEIDVITDENLRKQYDSYDGRTYISGILLQQKSLNWILEQLDSKK